MPKRRSHTRRRTSHPKQHTPSPRSLKLHANMWAVLTFASFIIVYLTAISMGAVGVMPFIYAAAMLFGVLLVESLIRGRLWLFEDGYRQVFGDPDLGLRLVVFSGMFLLIIETIILVAQISANMRA